MSRERTTRARYNAVVVGGVLAASCLLISLGVLTWAIVYEVKYQDCASEIDDEERDNIRYLRATEFVKYKHVECIDRCEGVGCRDCCSDDCPFFGGTLFVSGNLSSIVNGDATPSASDYTLFSPLLPEEQAIHNFTLRNDGAAPLRFLGNTVESGPGIRFLNDGQQGRFTVEDIHGGTTAKRLGYAGQSFVLAPGEIAHLLIRFAAIPPVGTYSDFVQLASSDFTDHLFSFAVSGSVVSPP